MFRILFYALAVYIVYKAAMSAKKAMAGYHPESLSGGATAEEAKKGGAKASPQSRPSRKLADFDGSAAPVGADPGLERKVHQARNVARSIEVSGLAGQAAVLGMPNGGGIDVIQQTFRPPRVYARGEYPTVPTVVDTKRELRLETDRQFCGAVQGNIPQQACP